MNKVTEELVRIVESIFPHRLYENCETLEKVQEQIDQIPTADRGTVIKELEAMDVGLGSAFGEENWAICIGLFGADASRCASKVWRIGKQAWSRPTDFAVICDALGHMKEALPALSSEITSRFNELVHELRRDFAGCTDEAARFAIGVERPCALVRLLGACGQSAQAAVPALKKYKSFIGGKSFIQSSMLVIDLDAGRVTPPPTSPVAQVREALKAIQAPGLLDKITSIFSGRK